MSDTTTSGDPPADTTTTDTPADIATSGDSPGNTATTDAPGADDFALELPVFQGPLELLLHLIEREELDITEVSLVAVTEQYLAHLDHRDHIDLGAIAAFIAVGARLLLLKSRALLPRDDDEEAADEDEERDPEALLEALREYRRYRAAAEHLRDLEEEHRTAYRREVAPPQLPPGPGLDGVTTDMLLTLFREVMARLPEEEQATELTRDPIRLADRVEQLVMRLEGGAPLNFREVIIGAPSRVAVIVDFLAVLELVRSGYVEARQADLFGEIELVAIAGAAPPSATRVAEELPGL